MTARVSLAPAEDGAASVVDAEWLEDLLAFDVTPTAGGFTTARLQMLVFTVALYADSARDRGAHAWPTINDLASLMAVTPEQIRYLLTIAVAAGWLVYGDDAPPLPSLPAAS